MAVVSKPLNPQKTKGYQWKDNVHAFDLIPRSSQCDHWFGYMEAHKTGLLLYKKCIFVNFLGLFNFLLQKVDEFPYVEACMLESLPMEALFIVCVL